MPSRTCLLVVEEIADDDDDAFAADLAGHVMEHRADVRLRVGSNAASLRHQLVDGRAVVAARRVIAHRRVEKPKRHGVALMEDQVSQARGHHLAVLQLRQLAGAVLHRLAAIEQDVGDVVRLLLVLLDVVTVRAAHDLPVQMPRVVAMACIRDAGRTRWQIPR